MNTPLGTPNYLPNLSQFTGTEQYHRLTIARRVLFTDGMQYVATEGYSFWLMDLIASILVESKESFIAIKVKVKDRSANVIFTDGNENPIHTQEIYFTDLAVPEIKFFAVNDTENWIVMLTSEY